MVDDDRSETGLSRIAQDGAVGELCEAVRRVQRELAAYPRLLPDRAVAEDELAALARQAAGLGPRPTLVDTDRLRHSLLLVAAAVGSVSALAAPLAALREAVEAVALPRFGPL